MIRSSSLNQSLLTLLIPVFLFFIGLTQTNAIELTLSWQDNSSIEEGFYIERSLGESGPFERIATLESNSTSYVDSSISYDFRYCYMVVAFNSNGSSSSEVNCNTVSQPSPGDDSLYSSLILSYTVQDEAPEYWKDTEMNNSFKEDPTLFETKVPGNTIAFGTDSNETNIHSHYNGEGSVTWTNYIYTGRMYITGSASEKGLRF